MDYARFSVLPSLYVTRILPIVQLYFYSTIVQYCTNYSQFRLEIYFSIFFQQNLKITLFCGKKWNEIEKESFESFFFVFGIFWAKVLPNFILMWQNENIHVVYSNARMTIWHFFTDTPMTWNMYHQFHTMQWKKNRKRILEFLFSSTNWRRTKLKSFFFFWCHLQNSKSIKMSK